MQSCLEMDNLSIDSSRYIKLRRASTKDKHLELPEIQGATSPRGEGLTHDQVEELGDQMI